MLAAPEPGNLVDLESAEQALAAGLVSRVVADTELGGEGGQCFRRETQPRYR